MKKIESKKICLSKDFQRFTFFPKEKKRKGKENTNKNVRQGQINA